MVDRGRNAEAGCDDAGSGLLCLAKLAPEVLDHLVLAEPDRGLAALVMDLLLVVDHADEHLRPAKIDADGLAGAQLRWRSGGGMRKY